MSLRSHSKAVRLQKLVVSDHQKLYTTTSLVAACNTAHKNISCKRRRAFTRNALEHTTNHTPSYTDDSSAMSASERSGWQVMRPAGFLEETTIHDYHATKCIILPCGGKHLHASLEISIPCTDWSCLPELTMLCHAYGMMSESCSSTL